MNPKVFLKSVYVVSTTFVIKFGFDLAVEFKRIDADKETRLKQIESDNRRIDSDNTTAITLATITAKRDVDVAQINSTNCEK